MILSKAAPGESALKDDMWLLQMEILNTMAYLY